MPVNLEAFSFLRIFIVQPAEDSTFGSEYQAVMAAESDADQNKNKR